MTIPEKGDAGMNALVADLAAWAATIASERKADELLDWNDLEIIRELLLRAHAALHAGEKGDAGMTMREALEPFIRAERQQRLDHPDTKIVPIALGDLRRLIAALATAPSEPYFTEAGYDDELAHSEGAPGIYNWPPSRAALHAGAEGVEPTEAMMQELRDAIQPYSAQVNSTPALLSVL